MHSPYTPPSPVPTSSSPESSVDDDVQSDSYNILTQLPIPSPKHQDVDHISIDSESQHYTVQAQPSSPEQAVPEQPLVSVCDKASLLDVLDRVRSLNSSISDAVNAVMGKGLKKLLFISKKDIRYFSLLARMAVEECVRAENQDLEMRNRFQNAILHDIIIDFIHECVEGNRMGKVTRQYEKFRMDIAEVRDVVPFVDAQNWARIAAKLVPDPPHELWDELAKKLARQCNMQLGKIIGTRNGTRPRSLIEIKMAPQYFSAILKSAYEVSMDIQSVILSQRLELTFGKKDSNVDQNCVQFGEEFSQVLQEESRYRDPLILGNRSFGLTGELDDRTRRVILKPVVDFYRPT